eukprot:Plantae.Rhodophyta-Purpureofilum_apyrenoidigerum.ctg14070.p1 GENE.Plantae.Rhodophyta-Purpureofilum_apyrenoidigerum.ctg14070~~Plantae.Rhodophyta-Purpureofilum_apyrenoidigerum.ctg14070.p1  ORF type:complete len:251 (+),score=38.82 Plantae.Rhodophyta-Purpureofilum_apyrenoidigerum.ctg14070:121-873(+)
MLAQRLLQAARAGCRSSLRPNPAPMLVRYKSSFESEKVRGASSLVSITDDYPPVPETIKDKDLPVGYEDSYYDKPHLIDPMDKTKRTNTYLILGAPKFIAASVARSVVLSFVYSMSASADVLALGTVEVDLNNIPAGSTATIKWRGKPVFIRHRTEDQVATATKDDESDLRDPEADAVRCQDPKWMIVLGVCTHLGCVPVADAGDYGGWFCPCHGSHYDVSGRIRKGPAPTNLEIPPYSFIEDGNKLLLG